MAIFRSAAIGPHVTPGVVKGLMIACFTIAIMTTVIQELCTLFAIFPGPENIFSLSWWGLHHWFFWQPFTFSFLFSGTGDGLSFSYAIALLANIYLIWIIGTALVETIGKRSFLLLWFLGSFAAAALSLNTMLLSGQYEMLTGMAPAILLITTVWICAFPETELFLFFLIPMKAKWIVAAVGGGLLLSALSEGDISLFSLYFCAILIGYGYAAYAWGWRSPYRTMSVIDDWLAKVGFSTPSGRSSVRSGKIIDISEVRKPQTDDAFVDAMLTKIARYGEDSLSWSERRRLRKISENKMHNNH